MLDKLLANRKETILPISNDIFCRFLGKKIIHTGEQIKFNETPTTNSPLSFIDNVM